MRKSLALVGLLLLSSVLHAQTAPPSNADILARIAALEQEIVALKAQLRAEPVSAAVRPPTLAEASAEAAKQKHEWPRSTNTFTNSDLKDGPPVAAPPPYRAPAPGPEQIRQGDYSRAALKDEMYWKARMQDVHAAVDDAQTRLAAAIVVEHDLDVRLHVSVDNQRYIRDRVLRAQVDGDWTAAVKEVSRLKAAVTNAQRAVTTAEEEARRANVPAGWLRP